VFVLKSDLYFWSHSATTIKLFNLRSAGMRRKCRGTFKFLYARMSPAFNNVSFETQAVSDIALSNILNAVLVRNNKEFRLCIL